MEAKITIDDAAVKELLGELSDRMEDMSPVMSDISDVLYDIVTDNFLAGGRPAWESLKPGTIKKRSEAGQWPGQILKRSGQLYSSITPFHTSRTAGVSTNKAYAATHQFGAKKGAFGKKTVTQQVREHMRKGKKVSAHSRSMPIQIPWGDIPARPFMNIPDDQIHMITDTIAEWLK